jgi:N-acetylglucosamine-6-phosphate deacetylase
MTHTPVAYVGSRIFDGVTMWEGCALFLLSNGETRILKPQELPSDCDLIRLDGGILSPGFVDLQVNGGGGVMFNDAPTVDTLRTISSAHRGLGTAAILPTLITDTPDQTAAAIKAVIAALDQKIPGIVGLHLEGPHLSVARKGAHDGALIRPMQDSDLRGLLAAAEHIPNLMMTVAPENVTNAQIKAMANAGVIVSLGHSDCVYDTAMAAFDAGARCATHLFNAMSQAQARAPGLVGAALDHSGAASGLIADGVHVHPAMIRAALAANNGPSDVFLVTDAMATAGSDITSFELNGREILRANGRLTLADGTLAGADLTMPQAIRVLVEDVKEPLEKALARATTIPARMLRSPPSLDRADDLVWLSDDLSKTRWVAEL